MDPNKSGALLVAVVIACEPTPAQPCGGFCGPGTVCSTDKCVPEAPISEPLPQDPPGKKRGRRRKAGGNPAALAEPDDPAGSNAPVEPLPPFVPVDDRSIPEFSADQTQTIDLNAGNERLSESVLDKHFARVTPKIQDCVATASRYGEFGSGRLAVQLRISPAGKVESVSVKAPASLRVWGIVPCARKAVYDHRFPSFDGPSIGVDFGVDID